MVNSVGKQLQQARLSKQLSIEEAARVTRIRPDKLIDLEEDNYANFPSMSYAKGFLIIYAKFLGVDVREFADTLHAPNPVSSDDYEYLSAGASGPAPPSTRRPYHFSARREHSILPLVVFALLAGAVVLGVYFIVTWNRIAPSLDDLSDKKDLSSPSPFPIVSTPLPAPVTAVPAPVVRTTLPEIVAASPVPAPTVMPGPTPVAPVTLAPSPVPAATFDPSREVRRAVPVFPTAPSHANASPASSVAQLAASSSPALESEPTPAAVKQVAIRPIKKTWVTVHKDVADSDPVFDDWLYPGDPALKLKGRKFWIQVQDPDAVQITQDGQPLPVGQSKIQIE
jgi:cytoskeletal protein RodZ